MARTICRLLLITLVLLFGCAQRPPEPPFTIKFDATINSRSIVKLAPGVFMVRDPLRFSLGQNYEPIVVPEGFIMDMATIPKVLRALEDRVDESMAPAIVHDYLYWYQPCSRSEADAIMLLAMSSLNVGELKAPAIYQAVRDFGESAYDENKQRRLSKQEVRTLTAEGMIWARDRGYLSSRKLEDVLHEARGRGELVRSEIAPRDIRPTCSAILAACKTCSSAQ